MATILTLIIISVLIFGLVVMIHELGHFVCAKKAGIQVNEFSIGMGPALFTTVRGGTRYSVRALPIGGYVSMEGEDVELEEPETGDALKELDPVEEQPKGLPFPQVKVWKRIIVVAAGAVMNLILGFLVLLLLLAFGDPGASKTVGFVEEGSPVQAAGLQVGDEILAVNGHHCFVMNDVLYELQRTPDQSADLTVKRNGEVIQLDNVGFELVENGDSVTMNIEFKVYALEKNVKTVVIQAFNYTLFYAQLVFRSLSDLVVGRVSVNELSGPVGIVSAIGQAASMGVAEVLSMLALLTVNLGVFNLLPVPALDGGKLVFLALEGIFRRPVPKKFEILVNAAGMCFLFGLLIFATFNDIVRLF